jgi:cytochrome P450
MLKDPRLGPPVLGLETADELMWRTFARWLLNLDGDRHRAMRQRFARIFTPGRVERYRPTIEGCARGDVEIDGYHVAAGQQRVVFPAGANRDPNTFTDPGTFDLGRSPNPHLAFSPGAHFCLGAPLARLHGEVTIRVLLERLPQVQLAGKPEWLGSIPLRVPGHLPIAWRPSRAWPGRNVGPGSQDRGAHERKQPHRKQRASLDGRSATRGKDVGT